MQTSDVETTSDAETLAKLRAMLEEMFAEDRGREAIDMMLELLAFLQKENASLSLKLKKQIKARFGQSSEKLSGKQLELFLDVLGLDDEDDTPAWTEDIDKTGDAEVDEHFENKGNERRARKRPGRRPLPKSLPREEIIIPVAKELRVCSVCGAGKKCLGHAKSEVLEWTPGQFKVLVYAREKLACKPCQGEVTIAPAADKVIEGGLPGPGLLTEIVLKKYRYAQPLWRQAHYFSTMGVDLAPSTMSGWVKAVGRLTEPIYREKTRLLLLSRCVNTEETMGSNLPPMEYMGRTVAGGTPDWDWNVDPQNLPTDVLFLSPRGYGETTIPCSPGVGGTARGYFNSLTGAGRGVIEMTSAKYCTDTTYTHSTGTSFRYLMNHEFTHLLGSWHETYYWNCPNDDTIPCDDDVASRGCTVMASGNSPDDIYTPSWVDQQFFKDGDPFMAWEDHTVYKKHQFSETASSWLLRSESYPWSMAPLFGLSTQDDNSDYLFAAVRSGSTLDTYGRIRRWDRRSYSWSDYGYVDPSYRSIMGSVDVDINPTNGNPYMVFLLPVGDETSRKTVRIAKGVGANLPTSNVELDDGRGTYETTADGASVAYDSVSDRFLVVWRNENLE